MIIYSKTKWILCIFGFLLVVQLGAQTNTTLGDQTGTGGSDNTFIGSTSGNQNTLGIQNTYLGSEAGYSNTTGYKNTFSGWGAGSSNTTGHSNLLAGAKAGLNNTSGYRNTIMGVDAGFRNRKGAYNTALGYLAARNNQNGNFNLSLGAFAGYENVGSFNIFIGNRAGFYETGSNKLYIDNSDTTSPLVYGDFSSNELTINGKQIVNGDHTVSGDLTVDNSLNANILTSNNMTSEDLTITNTLNSNNLNANTLTSNDLTSENLTVTNTLTSNTLTSNILISNNMATGNLTVNNSLTSKTLKLAGETGSSGLHLENEAPGTGCLSAKWHFSAVQQCGIGPIRPDYSLMTLYDDNGSGKVGIGTISPSYELDVNGTVRAAVYLTASDLRLKKEVKEIENANELVRQLSGVTYTYDNKARVGMNFPEGRQIGFIAQEVREILPEIVSEDDQGYLSVAYSSLIPVLVESQKGIILENEESQQTIYDLEDAVANLTEENVQLKSEIEQIKLMLAQLGDGQSISIENNNPTQGAKLYQNAPNPASESTLIRYFLPDWCKDVRLAVYNSQGGLVKNFEQLPTGEGKVTLDAFVLPTGTYHYQLICNGQALDAKSLIIVR